MNHEYFSKAWPNMFVNAHGQLQVGDMMGVPLAVIELLLQSQTEEIELLPALPKQWPTGKVAGLCARGGLVVDLAWQDGKLTKASLHATAAGSYKIRYNDKVIDLKTEANKDYPLTF